MHIECIESGDSILAYVIRADALPDRTTFLTPSELPFQLGFIVYPKGGQVPRHRHLPVERVLRSTSEFILVRKGRCVLEVFDDHQEPVAECQLEPGDAVLLIGGGHGFRMSEDTVLFEVKQGPYGGTDEKDRF